MVRRNRSVVLLFFPLFQSHKAIHVCARAKTRPAKSIKLSFRKASPPFLKMTLFLSPLLPCQFGFCSSISLFSLLPVASKKICKWRWTLNRKNVDISCLRRPLNTHESRALFSLLSSWPSFRCLCLFWLSLKHGLTITDVFPAPHPFILPIPEPLLSRTGQVLGRDASCHCAKQYWVI